MSKKIIFAHHTIQKLTSKVAKIADAEIGQISWKKFGDTWPKIFIEQAKQVKDRDVVFIANFEKPETIFEQFAILYAMPMHLTHSFKVIVPFFPVGTMERVTKYGEIATAKTLARMLSAIPRSPIITIFDIHALQTQFYFDDTRVLPELVSAIPLLKERLKKLDNIAIAFPDDGAYKRFDEMFPEYPKIICNKVRMPNGEKIVTIKEGDPAGKHVVIVDDLAQTGRTQLKCRIALLQARARVVSTSVTHGVYAENSWQEFTDPNLFSHVWFTDSCPSTVEATKHISNFEVLSIAPSIAEVL
ncbi:MAG: ribose-phosphate diphosphokinase [Candidatus Moraniibacteriota bacterium]